MPTSHLAMSTLLVVATRKRSSHRRSSALGFDLVLRDVPSWDEDEGVVFLLLAKRIVSNRSIGDITSVFKSDVCLGGQNGELGPMATTGNECPCTFSFSIHEEWVSHLPVMRRLCNAHSSALHRWSFA